MRGMARRDAEAVVTKMAQYENFFVSLMVSEELGVALNEDNDALLISDSFLMFLSYGSFGAIPIMIYALGALNVVTDKDLFVLSISVSFAILIFLGFMKSGFSSAHWLYSSLETLTLGIVVSSVAYLVGAGMVHIIVN